MSMWHTGLSTDFSYYHIFHLISIKKNQQDDILEEWLGVFGVLLLVWRKSP